MEQPPKNKEQEIKQLGDRLEVILTKKFKFIESVNRKFRPEMGIDHQSLSYSQVGGFDSGFQLSSEERHIVDGLDVEHQLSDDQQKILVEVVNRFTIYWLRLGSIQPHHLLVSADTKGEQRSFLCCRFVPRDQKTEFLIHVYSPIPLIDDVSEELKRHLDGMFEADVEEIAQNYRQLSAVDELREIPDKARKRLNYDKTKSASRKTEHQSVDGCDCHCIYACGYSLLVAIGKDPLEDFDPMTIRAFIRDTLSCGGFPIGALTEVASNEKQLICDLLMNHDTDSDAHKNQIVNIINRKYSDGRLRIMRHEERKGFIVVECTGERGKRVLKLFSSYREIGEGIVLELSESDKKAIDIHFKAFVSHNSEAERNPRKVLQYEVSKQPEFHDNRFLFSIGYAMSLARGKGVAYFFLKRNIEENNNKIREVLVEMLQHDYE